MGKDRAGKGLTASRVASNGETHRSCAIRQATMIHFDSKFIYFTSPVYTINNELLNSQKRRGVMMCSISTSRQFRHFWY
jgi:hypothetical protein